MRAPALVGVCLCVRVCCVRCLYVCVCYGLCVCVCVSVAYLCVCARAFFVRVLFDVFVASALRVPPAETRLTVYRRLDISDLLESKTRTSQAP